jgi:hypothetical protein
MPVTRSQSSAATALLILKRSVQARPQRKAATMARILIKQCAASDNEDSSK